MATDHPRHAPPGAPAARRRAGWHRIGAALVTLGLVQLAAAESWIGTWAAASQPEAKAPDTPALAGATLRQVVRVSLGGDRLRVRLSNAFGREPLVCRGAHVALAGANGAIQPDTDRALTISGQGAFTVPPGATYVSDPLPFPLAPQADVAISLALDRVPSELTAHPGSRATSYVQPGDALAAPALPHAARIVHWYFLGGIEVPTPPGAAGALVILGDSITDGYGTTTDGNNRWTDEFIRRHQARAGAPPLAVLNLGIGGNRLLRDGLGPSAVSRLERDVFAQPGARWLLVFAGINDIGTRLNAQKQGAPYASAADMIGALDQIALRAKAQGLRVLGATITPYEGAGFYWSEDGEADRQAVNTWIRTSGRFDAVVDFDAALRDPAHPTHLAAAYDCGDHLHPSLAGYVRLAEALDPGLFRP